MKTLAIDTASPHCSVALQVDEEYQHLIDTGPAVHAQRGLAMVDELMSGFGIALCDLDYMVCGIGPGSFTGLRVGVGAAQGLAYSGGLKVLGLNSLLAYLSPSYKPGCYAIASDARMGQLYSAGFEIHNNGSISETIVTGVFDPAAMDKRFTQEYSLIGTGWSAYKSSLSDRIRRQIDKVQSAESGDFPKAKHLLDWAPVTLAGSGALVKAAELVPFYVRNDVADKPPDKR